MGAIRAVVAVAAVCALAPAGTAAADPATDTLGAEQISRIVGDPGDPGVHLQQRSERGRPGATDPAAPGSCWAVSDEQAVFGTHWTGFHAVDYGAQMAVTRGGKGFPTVTQAVAAYPGAEAARAVFDRLGPALADCAAGHLESYEFTLARPDPATVTLSFPGNARATVVYTVRGARVARVSALAFDDSARIAQQVTDEISARMGPGPTG